MKYKLMTLLAIIPCLCQASGYIEAREAWNSASEEHQFKLGAGYNFANGAGLLYQSAWNTGKLDQLKHTFDELEGWYPLWVITDNLTLSPGGIINSTSAGSGTSPYIQLGYKYSDALGMAFKYRYNHMNYRTTNFQGEQKYNDSHQLITVLNYKINGSLSYEFEPNLFLNTGDYKRKNGRDHSWELNHKLTWKMTDSWRPFVQLSWLDRDIHHNAEQYRIRLGIRYYF